MKGRYGYRPYDAILVVVLLDNRCNGPFNPNAVTSHYGNLFRTVLVEIGGGKGFGVLVSKFKNMTNFNTFCEFQFTAVDGGAGV